MHCATWCPCIAQLYVHALCNFMSMHCATLSIYGKLGQTKSSKSCCPYIMQPDSQYLMSMYVCIVQFYVHALCNLMSMHCATWCPCIVQLDVHALCNFMSMHCTRLWLYCATWCPCIVQLDVHALCHLMSMHCTRSCIVQLDVHALCNFMSMHCTRLWLYCATWWPCTVQLDVHALCNLMSMHCATISIYGKLGKTKSTCCPYIMQPDSQSYVHVFMYCATLCPCIIQLDVHALCKLMSMHCATWCPCIVQLYQYMEN